VSLFIEQDDKSAQTITNKFGGVVHHIHLAEPSVDLVLVQQAKMLGFMLKTGTLLRDARLEPVPRSAKDVFRGN